jgi:hypothetical protein
MLEHEELRSLSKRKRQVKVEQAERCEEDRSLNALRFARCAEVCRLWRRRIYPVASGAPQIPSDVNYFGLSLYNIDRVL